MVHNDDIITFIKIVGILRTLLPILYWLAYETSGTYSEIPGFWIFYSPPSSGLKRPIYGFI